MAARATRADVEHYKEWARSLTDKLVGFNEIITILSIQRNNRLLDSGWRGFQLNHKDRPSNMDTHYWLWEATVEEKYDFIRPNLELTDMFTIVAEAMVNMATCSHEVQEKTGEQIPMGSFTAQPSRCQRCGKKFHDD